MNIGRIICVTINHKNNRRTGILCVLLLLATLACVGTPEQEVNPASNAERTFTQAESTDTVISISTSEIAPTIITPTLFIPSETLKSITSTITGTFTNSPTSTATITASKTPTYTLTPTFTKTLTRTATKTATITPPVAGLPGLMPADVKVNMEERGFTCELVSGTGGSDPFYYWECLDESFSHQMIVEISSKSLITVDVIEATILQFGTPDINLATQFLGFMATMPYDGATPSSARSWVETTLPTITSAGVIKTAAFGGVTYLLFGIPTAYILEFGDVEP